ncbi:MAG: hypothetical protein GTO55_08480 [Armatimonadetes bacterium]|nr:hypothetical protein [Armatimonadota bacterium]NIM24281.1 hypothetical protein [Armatimonadota bacterium]NIM68150.1 hypothetical protein [Armatimonadota bacterium]NIM76610.1 hypothetical protein [Armatimonadota bacterium]NIN06355.1 hypothetical protein [Armatimonadota bacterium]
MRTGLAILVVVLVVMLSWPAHVLGQIEPDEDLEEMEAVSEASPAEPVVVEKRGNLVFADGAPLLLMWARGLTDMEEVEAYAEAGLNVLHIEISWADEESLAAADELMAAGEDLYLGSLVGLDASAAELDENDEFTIAAHPRSSVYQNQVRSFVSATVSALRDRPGLFGWIVEGLSPEIVPYSDADFQRWLREVYEDIKNLNEAWSSRFSNFSEISQDSPAEVDAFLEGQFGRATIDLGLYRYWLYRELLDLWASEIAAADANHLIILGDQVDFRSLTVPSDSYDGMISLAAEPAPAAGGGFIGIEAIDMARRGNHFLAFGFADAAEVSAATLYDWAGECLLHGATGIGLDGWASIRNDAGLQNALVRLNDLAVGLDLFPRTPQVEAAFLYEPFTGGEDYGFCDFPPSAEPGILFQTFGRGTRFGLMDYLTADMLTDINLNRYGVIFAPRALTISPLSQQALIEYVSGGGILVADWGIGLYESRTLNLLPEALADLFGPRYIAPIYSNPFDLVVMESDPLFPSMPEQAMTSGRREGGAFSGLIGDVWTMGDVKEFMTRHEFGARSPSILINNFGAGHAIFASAPLWENWQSGDALFDEFHGDLIGRRRPVTIMGGEGLFTPAEAVLFDDGAVGLFQPATSRLFSQVLSRGDGSTLFQVDSGLQLAGGSQPYLIFGGAGMNIAVPLPIRVLVEEGRPFLQVQEYGSEAIVLEIHGPQASLVSRDGVPAAEGGGEFSLTLLIRSDSQGYGFSGGSSHLVSFVNLSDEEEEIPSVEVEASADGVLEVTVFGTALEVTIEPAGIAVEPAADFTE